VKKWPVLVVAAAVVLGSHHADLAAMGHAGAHHAAAAISGPVTRNANEALANQMAASGYGWTGSQATCLDELWTRESGFSQYADTRKSGLDPPGAAVYAYGIPQARPAQKMASAGSDWQTNPATQVKWGLRYLKDIYGSPCAAWSHETANSWY
jgi:hypothetical protein